MGAEDEPAVLAALLVIAVVLYAVVRGLEGPPAASEQVPQGADTRQATPGALAADRPDRR